MTDLWSDRADAYRSSPIHASGDDLDLVVEWCAPAPGVTVLDVATGGGHVARRLREAGAEVVTVDAAPGMQPDVVAPASATASAIVSKTGTPSTSWPPLPGVTPATTFVPYALLRRPWKRPSEPVSPATTRRVSLSTMIATSA